MAFSDIFKDENEYNEKAIIGFMSFGVMTLTAIIDIVTGAFGKELLIQEFIYNLFQIYMDFNWYEIIGFLFAIWLLYFSIGTFANMTENKFLLKLFNSFFYILMLLIIILLILIYLLK